MMSAPGTVRESPRSGLSDRYFRGKRRLATPRHGGLARSRSVGNGSRVVSGMTQAWAQRGQPGNGGLAPPRARANSLGVSRGQDRLRHDPLGRCGRPIARCFSAHTLLPAAPRNRCELVPNARRAGVADCLPRPEPCRARRRSFLGDERFRQPLQRKSPFIAMARLRCAPVSETRYRKQDGTDKRGGVGQQHQLESVGFRVDPGSDRVH